MEAVVYWLNTDGTTLSCAELKRLVEAWNNSGRNLARMLESHSELYPYIYHDNGTSPFQGILVVDGSGLAIGISALIGVNRWVLPEHRSIDLARQMFIELLINPQRELLSDKPCARCGRYYCKKTARQKVYCSRKCGKDGTAAYATKKRLRAERQNKLLVAAGEAQKWTSARTKEDWKRWVSKQAAGRHEGLTPKFLTRAVNKGELTEPTKGER